jgi:phosphate/sulfate permease
MRFITAVISALAAALLGGVASVFLAMQLGAQVSSYEPGAYLGVALAIILAPIGAVTAGWVVAVLVWQAWARRRRQQPNHSLKPKPLRGSA